MFEAYFRRLSERFDLMSKKKRGDDISHLACHQKQRSMKIWTSTPRQEERHFMNQTMFGTTHPDAPPELAQFAFLIGTWKCKGKVKSPEGEWQDFAADWIGQYILDGKAIADSTFPIRKASFSAPTI